MLELGFCSLFAPRPWHIMDDRERGQNTAIEGQKLDKKAKNPVKHIKQLYPSINQE